MKKLILLLVVGLFTFNSAYSRDYTKIQVKEIKHAQKYGTTNKYFTGEKLNNLSNAVVNKNLKDPKVMRLYDYTAVDEKNYQNKLSEDEKKYAKIQKSLKVRNVDNYNAQAKGEDYYKIYRIAEKMIRANNLDFINWRIGIYRDEIDPNAYSTNMNYIAISTSLYDTFQNNDDALAFVIGHEMAHALLGHQQRRAQRIYKREEMRELAQAGNVFAGLYASVENRRFLIDSKNMEYAADVEGAKLALQAGYNIESGFGVLSFFNALPNAIRDYFQDHPHPVRRIENYNQNKKYFMEDEWVNIGKYNIYNSEVLDVNLSSDRKSIVINAPTDNVESGKYYRPESMKNLYARLGYKSYLNGEFDKSIKYFDELFEIDTKNAPAYLYASYASMELYKKNKSSSKGEKYLKMAKDYAKEAYKLDPNNEYIKEQFEEL